MSKCDELKRYDIETDHGDTYEGVVAPDGFYMIADEVDEAIVEIKVENVRLKAENKGLKDENARLMSRPCYVCKEEQVKDLEKKFQELDGGTLILYNENFRWRKTSEEIPSENDYYLVSDGKNVFMEYGSYNEQDEVWNWDHGESRDTWKYWRPMPKAPEEAK